MLKQYLSYKYFSQFSSYEEAMEEYKRNPKSFQDCIDKIIVPTSKGYILKKECADEISKMIRRKELPLVMDESDVVIGLDVDMPDNVNKRNGFESSKDIMVVHKTPILPEKDTIHTAESNGVCGEIMFQVPGTEDVHKVPYLIGNDTIHFTLNTPVENHQYGNDWNDMKYAVVAPFSSIDKTKILDIKSEDTYVDGNVRFIGPYYVFCPEGESKKVSEKNPNAVIIEYSKETDVNKAVKSFIAYSGKKVKDYGSFGWGKEFEFMGEDSDEKNLRDVIAKENLPCIPGKLHSETKYMSRRMWKREYNAYTALIKYLKENNINMPAEIIPAIVSYGGGFSLPGTVPTSIELYKEMVVPIIEKQGYKIPEDFFEGIVEDRNIKMIETHTPSGQPQIYAPSWEVELRKRAINLMLERTPEKNVENVKDDKIVGED